MRKKRHHYSEEERLSILRDYYSSGMSMYACAKKYQLSTETLLIKWKKLYESHPEIVSLHSELEELDMANRDKESYKEEIAQLKKRNKELEKALAFSKWETEARDIMISIAEEQFNISIRKKAGAKQ
ncbi:MAG: transposase [Bacteroidaceae bacterium]|nr:transposase [Bacteroidaceae bacterium]